MIEPDARKINLLMELRRCGIDHTDVLRAIEQIPREAFIADVFWDRAYENIPLPIGHGQSMADLLTVAQILSALKPDKRATVLEIGTGSGYGSALLTMLFLRVYTMERLRPLFDEAQRRFHDMNLDGIITQYGDGLTGWEKAAPFDRILLNGAVPFIPEELAGQLKEGGILLGAVMMEDGTQQLVRVRRRGAAFDQEILQVLRITPLLSSVFDGNKKFGVA